MIPPVGKPDLHLQFIKKSDRAEVTAPVDDLVSTAPHLLVREAVAAEVVILLLSVVSLVFNAPLEEIANPFHTPNPSKAPWYFLGLQELLHYFPPVVAGVLIPTLVVLALVVIPYFGVNAKPRRMRSLNSKRALTWVTVTALMLTGVTLPFACWPLMVVTIITWIVIVWGMIGKGTLASQVGHLTVPDWIMVWFVAAAIFLTIIGTFFRGPGWIWVWPWNTGAF